MLAKSGFSLPLVLFAMAPALASTNSSASHPNNMTMLAMQIGILLICARLVGRLFAKFKLPSVLGELVAGMLVGPYMLGSFPLPGLPQGLFPLASGSLPVSVELYGIATIASILLLFMAGIETDLKLFLRFSLAGSAVGLGGVIFSFLIGAGTVAWLWNLPFMDMRCLFAGIMSTATSVGITARILSEKRKLDTPEGVTIIAGAVIDDILGIILLAVVVGISAIGGNSSEHTDWGAIVAIGAKAIGAWLIFTTIGLVFSNRIANFLRKETSPLMISIQSFALALIVAGIFEFSGLALIIGAYVMGLSLSKTDLRLTIWENLDPIQQFLVPLFFATMGMLVNLPGIMSPQLLWIGGIYTLGAIIAKVAGAGIPALLLGFNWKGALRIGTGMIPRGEVALIIAGIGLASGILDQTLFSIAVMMTICTTICAPLALNHLFSLPGSGRTKGDLSKESQKFTYTLGDNDLADLLQHRILHFFMNEGYVLHRLPGEQGQFHLQRKENSIAFSLEESTLHFECAQQDLNFVRILVHEALLDLKIIMDRAKHKQGSNSLQKLVDATNTENKHYSFHNLLKPEHIIMRLSGKNKPEILEELLENLHSYGVIPHLEDARKAIWKREQMESTNLPQGFAIPHARIDGIQEMQIALGITEKENPDTADEITGRVFFLVLIPAQLPIPYVKFLAAASNALSTPEKVAQLCSLRFRHQIIEFFENS